MTDRRCVPRQVRIGDLGLENQRSELCCGEPAGRPRRVDGDRHAAPVSRRQPTPASTRHQPKRCQPKRCQPTRCPTGFGPAPLTAVMYTGRDSVEAWITWPPPIYIATWLTGE
jgi:hypothetical protein